MKAARQLSLSTYDPHLYLDRDMSLLAFNARVLAQAENKNLPVMERLRYLCIAGSNLDEFFEVRTASLHARRESNANRTASEIDELLHQISKECHALVEKQYHILNHEVLPLLAKNGIYLLGRHDRNEAQQAWVKTFFDEHIRPVMTPIVLDPAHPFPQVANKSLHFIIALSGKDAFGRGSDIAILKAPRVLPRVIRLPDDLSPDGMSFCLLSSIIYAHIPALFAHRKVVASSQFRVTRDSDLWVDEEEVKNLREALQSSLNSRNYGNAVRLEVAADCPRDLSDFLLQQFHLEQKDVYYAQGPVNVVRLCEFFDHVKKPDLYFPSYTPSVLHGAYSGHSLFDSLKQKDILLHHPFQSFQTVIDFINTAAADPTVIV
ncbi:MAG: RNA degradosome polyphosphate kinase, partial [Burkholderiaceae bacterium]|nr:RNA degradosome polyphosphate kinase [Burkholderiaceae bacterium]